MVPTILDIIGNDLLTAKTEGHVGGWHQAITETNAD